MPDASTPDLRALLTRPRHGNADAAARKLRGADRISCSVPPPPTPDGLTPEEEAFAQAMDVYKCVNLRPFPTWSEALWVLKRLGYTKEAGSTASQFTAEAAERAE